MSVVMKEMLDRQAIIQVFGDRVRFDVPLARYTAARVGGPAAALIEATSKQDLAEIAQTLWGLSTPFVILGGGSNVLINDAGILELVLLNHAKEVQFVGKLGEPQVWAESGANFGALARQAAQHGLSGLEWAAGIPGTIGGAVFGNAGAHGSDMAANLIMAEILHRNGKIETWSAERMGFTYRSSNLKDRNVQARKSLDKPIPESVILSALLRLELSSTEAVQEQMDIFLAHRRRTQPPGASMGSMFKNPPGDYAGRLIEAVGLKGTYVGDAEISTLHANFFINHGKATASNIYQLIELARRKVAEELDINLELEIELLGEW